MTDTNTDAPPDGWVPCQDYPAPGDTILLWRPASNSRMVRPLLGYGREVPVRSLPVHHFATLGGPVTPTDTNPSASHTSNTPDDPYTDSTAGQRDAYLAGFDAGARWERIGRPGTAASEAVQQYERWTEGEDA